MVCILRGAPPRSTEANERWPEARTRVRRDHLSEGEMRPEARTHRRGAAPQPASASAARHLVDTFGASLGVTEQDARKTLGGVGLDSVRHPSSLSRRATHLLSNPTRDVAPRGRRVEDVTSLRPRSGGDAPPARS